MREHGSKFSRGRTKRIRMSIYERREFTDMALEDYMEPEVAVTAVVVAAIASPKARQVLRRGAVYGLAGILTAGDAIASVGKSIGRGVQAASSTGRPEATSEAAGTREAPKDATTRHAATKSAQEEVGGKV